MQDAQDMRTKSILIKSIDIDFVRKTCVSSHDLHMENRKTLPPIRVDMDLDLYNLSPYEFRIYGHIARRGECFSSLKTIAAICNMSVRQAQYALEELEKLGLIIKESHPGKTSVYKIADQTKWKKRSYKTKLNSPLEYFNRAVVRREKKDLQGALEDFEMSLQLYELEIQKLIKSGKQATRKQKDIDDTKKEIKKIKLLIERSFDSF